MRFLIVEDEPDSAEVVEMILEPAHVDSQLAANAEDALTLLQEDPNQFSGVLIDLALPGMDGFALMQAIRKDAQLKNLRLVAMTAYHTPELKSRAIKSGFDAYFPKPLNTAVFIGTLERLFSD